MPPILHPLPHRGAVVREQLATVGLSLRREALLAGGALGAFTVWMALQRMNSFHAVRLDLVPEAMMPLVALAFFAALGVWKTEDPARRGYHWSMPVEHGTHALAKGGSGLAWLLAAGAGYFAWLTAMAFFTGGRLGMEWTWISGTRQLQEVAAWRWVVPFVGAAVLYGFGTALALVSRFPWRWVAGGVVGLVFLNAWDAAVQGTTPVHDLLDALWEGRYGLWTLVSGLSPDVWEEHSWNYVPHFGRWVTASALWLGAAASAVLAAARFQPRG